MAQRSRLLLEFLFAIAVCGVIALFDRVLIGLIGAIVCTAIFAVRVLLSKTSRSNLEEAEVPPIVVRESDTVVYGHAPHCYRPGNPVYYPPDIRDYPHGD